MPSLLMQESTREEEFDTEEYPLLNSSHFPTHIAIIMDGNRRWAKRRGLPAVAGHWRGAEILTRIVRAAADLGVKVLTVYSFSTENWSRSQEEIDALMHLIKSYLKRQLPFMLKEGVRLDTIGDISRLPPTVQEVLQATKEATKQGNKIDLVLALNYGGRDEIRRATLAVLEDLQKGKIDKNDFSETLFSQYLDTAKWGDPQLLIRTSGEKRLSNFLLWQISYSEVYLTDVLWPDFSKKELMRAILEYQSRELRLGK